MRSKARRDITLQEKCMIYNIMCKIIQEFLRRIKRMPTCRRLNRISGNNMAMCKTRICKKFCIQGTRQDLSMQEIGTQEFNFFLFFFNTRQNSTISQDNISCLLKHYMRWRSSKGLNEACSWIPEETWKSFFNELEAEVVVMGVSAEPPIRSIWRTVSPIFLIFWHNRFSQRIYLFKIFWTL